jgi:hypothetical protein
VSHQRSGRIILKWILWSRLWLCKLGWGESESRSLLSLGVDGIDLKVLLAEMRVQLKMSV